MGTSKARPLNVAAAELALPTVDAPQERSNDALCDSDYGGDQEGAAEEQIHDHHVAHWLLNGRRKGCDNDQNHGDDQENDSCQPAPPDEPPFL